MRSVHADPHWAHPGVCHLFFNGGDERGYVCLMVDGRFKVVIRATLDIEMFDTLPEAKAFVEATYELRHE